MLLLYLLIGLASGYVISDMCHSEDNFYVAEEMDNGTLVNKTYNNRRCVGIDMHMAMVEDTCITDMFRMMGGDGETTYALDYHCLNSTHYEMEVYTDPGTCSNLMFSAVLAQDPPPESDGQQKLECVTTLPTLATSTIFMDSACTQDTGMRMLYHEGLCFHMGGGDGEEEESGPLSGKMNCASDGIATWTLYNDDSCTAGDENVTVTVNTTANECAFSGVEDMPFYFTFECPTPTNVGGAVDITLGEDASCGSPTMGYTVAAGDCVLDWLTGTYARRTCYDGSIIIEHYTDATCLVLKEYEELTAACDSESMVSIACVASTGFSSSWAVMAISEADDTTCSVPSVSIYSEVGVCRDEARFKPQPEGGEGGEEPGEQVPSSMKWDCFYDSDDAFALMMMYRNSSDCSMPEYASWTEVAMRMIFEVDTCIEKPFSRGDRDDGPSEGDGDSDPDFRSQMNLLVTCPTVTPPASKAYVHMLQHQDEDACSDTPGHGIQYETRTCLSWLGRAYAKLHCSDTEVLVRLFNDSACSVPMEGMGLVYHLDTCNQPALGFKMQCSDIDKSLTLPTADIYSAEECSGANYGVNFRSVDTCASVEKYLVLKEPATLDEGPSSRVGSHSVRCVATNTTYYMMMDMWGNSSTCDGGEPRTVAHVSGQCSAMVPRGDDEGHGEERRGGDGGGGSSGGMQLDASIPWDSATAVFTCPGTKPHYPKQNWAFMETYSDITTDTCLVDNMRLAFPTATCTNSLFGSGVMLECSATDLIMTKYENANCTGQSGTMALPKDRCKGKFKIDCGLDFGGMYSNELFGGDSCDAENSLGHVVVAHEQCFEFTMPDMDGGGDDRREGGDGPPPAMKATCLYSATEDFMFLGLYGDDQCATPMSEGMPPGAGILYKNEECNPMMMGGRRNGPSFFWPHCPAPTSRPPAANYVIHTEHPDIACEEEPTFGVVYKAGVCGSAFPGSPYGAKLTCVQGAAVTTVFQSASCIGTPILSLKQETGYCDLGKKKMSCVDEVTAPHIVLHGDSACEQPVLGLIYKPKTCFSLGGGSAIAKCSRGIFKVEKFNGEDCYGDPVSQIALDPEDGCQRIYLMDQNFYVTPDCDAYDGGDDDFPWGEAGASAVGVVMSLVLMLVALLL